jgi:hypothetical protein
MIKVKVGRHQRTYPLFLLLSRDECKEHYQFVISLLSRRIRPQGAHWNKIRNNVATVTIDVACIKKSPQR